MWAYKAGAQRSAFHDQALPRDLARGGGGDLEFATNLRKVSSITAVFYSSFVARLRQFNSKEEQ
ncbi:hypothetical protein BC937DRAFT_90060 [Endogone sp. FLAS-F59071]|nr:hypothetical protein BC937DRAFT_90060 [Endogone sp. FLAS-F59071]|eukprot:RUS17379.1 hypothetical protein BC937DRAFT_90060 [Endogone sp. FLAS-F59071]